MEMDELVQQANETQQRERERKALASDIGSRFPKQEKQQPPKIENHSHTQVTPQVNVNLPAIKTLTAEFAEIRGLEDSLDEIARLVESVVSAIERIEFNPTFNVPASKLRVEIPKVVVPPINVPPVVVNVDTRKLEKIVSELKQSKENVINMGIPNKDQTRLAEEKELYQGGFYDGYEETFTNGSKHRVTGYSRGKVKHEYVG